MANIHRLNRDDDDMNNRGFNSFGIGQQQQQIGALDPSLKIPFMSSGQTENVSARNETFWQMLKFNLCPSFKSSSMTFLVLIFNTLVFALECMKCQNMGHSFLEINQNTLIDMGANVPTEIKQNNGYYRLVSSIFLHASFMHLLYNQISVIFIMSALEYSYGAVNIILIYILSGIGGNVFADNMSQHYQVFVGCSGAITGILASVIAYFIIHWNQLQSLGSLREYFLCIFVMVVIMGFLFPSSSQISTFSHLGGFLVGLFAGMAIPKPQQQSSYEYYARILGWVLLIMFFFLGFLMIATAQ